MGVSNDDEDGDGVDGDGSVGNSPSRQGAGIETFVSRNSSSMTAALRNFSRMEAWLFRVFPSEAIYERKGDVRGHPRGPHHMVAQLGVGPRHPMVWSPPGSSSSPLWTPCTWHKKYELQALFHPIPRIFPSVKTWNRKTTENRIWHCGILLIG
jgi:hypothetical protein